MGNYASKLLSYTESQKECNEQGIEQQSTMEDNSTPVSSKKKVLGDPRSVSAGIRRTPIEVKFFNNFVLWKKSFYIHSI